MMSPMTVLDLGRAPSGSSGPTITRDAEASPSPATGTTAMLSVGADDPAGAMSLSYAWATIGRTIRIQHHRGRRDAIQNAGDDGLIAPGQTVSFRLLGSAGRVPAAPTGYVFNGVPVD
jgi:hypothetical protein